MSEEYTVKMRVVTEVDSRLRIDVPAALGDSTEFADKAIYKQAASGGLAGQGETETPVVVNAKVVSVYRGDVRIYPRTRTLKPIKPAEDKPTKNKP